MSIINNGGPAFPSKKRVFRQGYETNEFEPVGGMTLRDYFAASVNVGEYFPIETFKNSYGRKPNFKELAEYIAQIRMLEADAMLKAREAK